MARKRRNAALWAIPSLGILAILAFGMLSLWNSKSPLMRLRLSLYRRFKIPIAATELEKNSRGEVDRILVKLNNEEPLGPGVARELGCWAFLELERQVRDHKIREVEVQSGAGGAAVTVQAAEAMLFRSLLDRRPMVSQLLIVNKLGLVSDYRVGGGDADGPTLTLTIKNAPVLDPRAPARIRRTIEKACGQAVGGLTLILKGSDGKTRRKSWDGQGRALEDSGVPPSGPETAPATPQGPGGPSGGRGS